MSSHYKAFLLVIVVTLVSFAATRAVFAPLMGAENFARRRNAWLALTVLAFLTPSFWLYALLGGLVIAYATSKDDNPGALYLMLLLAVPPLSYTISGLGFINQLFQLDHLRLLSLACLLPVAVRLANAANARYRQPDPSRKSHWSVADGLVVAYVVLQLLILMPYESVTASMRRSFLLSIDILLPYYVLSRSCSSPHKIQDAMASFALAMVVLTPLALFESFKGWLLYSGIEEEWGYTNLISYLRRDDLLRAQVSGGQAIVFGNAAAVALGFWLFLQSRIPSRTLAWIGGLALAATLAATISRGPWVGAALTVVAFLLIGPGAAGRTAKALALTLAVGGVLAMTPWGEKIVYYLPFVGTGDEGSVTYRQRLAEISWNLVMQQPFFGVPGFISYMEEMRTGEGIIDLVNTYATIALSFGLTGLALFAGVFIDVLVRCLRTLRSLAQSAPEMSLMGSSLFATTLGALLIIATVSNYLSIPYLYWSLAGLCAAYARMGRQVVAVAAVREPRLMPMPRG